MMARGAPGPKTAPKRYPDRTRQLVPFPTHPGTGIAQASTLTGMDPPVLTFSDPPSAQTRVTAQVEPRSARGAAYRGATATSHGQRCVRGGTCGPAWVNREGGLWWWR